MNKNRTNCHSACVCVRVWAPVHWYTINCSPFIAQGKESIRGRRDRRDKKKNIGLGKEGWADAWEMDAHLYLFFRASCCLYTCLHSVRGGSHCRVAFLLFLLCIHSCPYVGLSFEDVVIRFTAVLQSFLSQHADLNFLTDFVDCLITCVVKFQC